MRGRIVRNGSAPSVRDAADTAGEPLGAILRYLSITDHSSDLIRGVVDTKTLVYFASMIVGWMFLTQRSVESIRWR